mmetsp:Transcript_7982/g.19278  ORF Transcript_7982/g.19278 Transcript_7982/m.19278 type:complete len:147 (-) Transcript_7982:287-727(-)
MEPKLVAKEGGFSVGRLCGRDCVSKPRDSFIQMMQKSFWCNSALRNVVCGASGSLISFSACRNRIKTESLYHPKENARLAARDRAENGDTVKRTSADENLEMESEIATAFGSRKKEIFGQKEEEKKPLSSTSADSPATSRLEDKKK